MRNMINNIKEIILSNKKKAIIIIIILVILITLMLWPKEDNKSKVYTNSNYVITYDKTKIEGTTSKMPYINLKGDDVNDVNSLLMQKYYECEELNDRYMDYEVYTNDKILSLITKIYMLEDDFIASEINFYNFDIETGVSLTNDNLKELYEINDTFIEEKLNTLIKDYYDYEVSKGYVDKETCDFTCYNPLFYEDYLDNLEYYVKDNNLYTYYYFNIGSDFAYDSDNPFDIFRFKIK